jgi:RNA-directed DNA polymerase
VDCDSMRDPTPERNAHQALRVVRSAVMERGRRWILDVDLRKYFDSIDPAKLRELLDRRVTDGVVRRLIDKWLKAGVLEDGQVHYPDTGTPQGGVISPCLANVFLHYVLDVWFTEAVQPRLRGRSTLVRFADDCVPRTRDLKSGECDAAPEMREGPSKPACRSRLQTTLSCWGQESWW